MELIQQLSTCFTIVSTCITIYIFCKGPNGVYWLRVITLSIVAALFLSICNLTLINVLFLIGEIIAIISHSRHPLTQQIHYGRLMMIVGASLVLFLISQAALPEWHAVTHSNQAGGIITSATATLRAANPNPYPPHEGTLVLYDPLSDNSQGWDWIDPSLFNNPNCYFAENTYHAVGGTQGGTESGSDCAATKTDFTNFAFEVQMKFIKGHAEDSSGGISFRDNVGLSTKDEGWYSFIIRMNGSYNLQVCLEGSCIDLTSPSWAIAKAIHTGLDVSNVIAIVAKNNTFDLYANGEHIAGPIINGNHSASVLTHGTIGVSSMCVSSCEISYSNAKVWSL